MKRVFVIHGYTGYPDKNWFPWLKAELEKLGAQTTVPAMPHTEAPQLSEWLPCLQAHIGTADEETYLVGHSLGCITILRYLESLSRGVKIGGVVLVAGFASPIHFHKLDNFFTTPLDDEKIKTVTRKIVAISSDDDPHIPFVQAQELRDRFGAEFITIHNGQHLNEKAGYTEFPQVLEVLKKMMGL